MGSGAKPQWVGNEGEALPRPLPRVRCVRMHTAERGFIAEMWCVKGITIFFNMVKQLQRVLLGINCIYEDYQRC